MQMWKSMFVRSMGKGNRRAIHKTQKQWSNKNAMLCILYYLAVVFSRFFPLFFWCYVVTWCKKLRYKSSPYNFFFGHGSCKFLPWNYIVLSYKYSFIHSFILLALFMVGVTVTLYNAAIFCNMPDTEVPYITIEVYRWHHGWGLTQNWDYTSKSQIHNYYNFLHLVPHVYQYGVHFSQTLNRVIFAKALHS